MTDKQDPIAHAARLLREAAEELRQSHTLSSDRNNWIGEPEAKAAYDEHMAAAQALEDWEAAVGAGGVSGPLVGRAAPPTAQAEGWTKASEQLPPCRDEQLYIGVNSVGYAGVFNAVASIAGNVHCMYETAEGSTDVMSDLAIWKPFNPPTSAEVVEHG